MCKICEPDVREQEVADYMGHYIAEEPIPFGNVSKNRLRMELWYFAKDTKHYLETSITDDTGEAYQRMDLDISYCPFCGRKL